MALVVSLLAFRHFTQSPAPRQADATVAPVRVGIVTRRDMAIIERSTGSVIAATSVQVQPLVTGQITQQRFREGQFVSRGEVLFQIDPGPYRAALAQARGVWAKDQASLQIAQRDQQRYAALATRGFVTVRTRDAADASVAGLAATLASDKAAIDAAALNLKYTTIRSPIDGKTGPVLVQPGNIANAASTAALVTISQVRPVKVSFTLPESDLPRIQARQRAGGLLVRLEPQGADGRTLVGRVDFVSNAVSAQSGTIELRATFANEDVSLVPGQLVPVVVELGDLPRALVVPRDAVNDSPSGSFVYAVRAGRSVVRQVTVLFDDGQNVAVTGDVRPGEQVITEGQLRVDAGAPVHVLGRSLPRPKMASDKIHPAR